jgi:thiol:disulfide interchange protein DsbA
MKNMFVRLSWLFASILLILSTQSIAEETWQEGRHYKTLPMPVKTEDPSKLEVLEVFWYGCPHCYEFNNDYLPKWEASLPDDVNFTLLPATFRGWKEHAKVFYAAKFLGIQKDMHQALFDTIQSNPRKYKEVEDLKPLFIKQGVDEKAFDQLFETGGFRKVSQIDQAIAQADAKVNSFRITGVPALIVNGKYKVGVQDAGNFTNMLKIVDFLLEKERQALAKN